MLKYLFLNGDKDIETRLKGTRLSAFLSELLTNSGHFLLINVVSEIALMGWYKYVTELGHYLILIAMLIQCWYLSRQQANRFWGNLIGCSLYTITDLPLDGLEFFEQVNHGILWVFSLLIAILQGLRFNWKPEFKILLIPLESIIRMGMLVALYITLSLNLEHENWSIFYLSIEHKFLIFSLSLVGLLVGLQTLQVTVQRQKLQETAKILQEFAQWGLGNHVVNMAFNNPEKLDFQRQNRAIIFMDIRGFTAWCEKNNPSQVANLLNTYYQIVAPIAYQYQPLRVTLTADEIMAIYTTPELAVKAAIAMQENASNLLTKYGLGAGCGIHWGSVVEGLFGSDQVRTYTVLGDVVNTAKRLEGATPAGEITISDAIYQVLKDKIEVKKSPSISLKGKSQVIEIWRLLSFNS